MKPIAALARHLAVPVRSALAVILVIAASAAVAATPPPPAADLLMGVVLETRNFDNYTCLRLKTSAGETWAAVPATDVKPGSQVTIVAPVVMENFESRAMQRKFDRILFGQLAPASGGLASAGTAATTLPRAAAIKVDRATGPDARSVAEVVTGKARLKDKNVRVRGQVVKVNSGVMGKNWLHLRDGTGSAADGSDDILVTTTDSAAIGDIVSVTGTVRTDVNLGSGYVYSVLIENAAVRK